MSLHNALQDKLLAANDLHAANDPAFRADVPRTDTVIYEYDVTIPDGNNRATYHVRSNIAKHDLTRGDLFPTPAHTYKHVRRTGTLVTY